MYTACSTTNAGVLRPICTLVCTPPFEPLSDDASGLCSTSNFHRALIKRSARSSMRHVNIVLGWEIRR